MKRRLEKFCKDLIKNGGKGVSRGTVVRAIRDIINPVQIIYDEVVDENGKSVKP